MKMYKLIFLILFTQLAILHAEEKINKSGYIVAGGFNNSSFIRTNSDWNTNYSIGLFIDYDLMENISILPMIIYSRYSSYVKNRKGLSISWDDIAYRSYYDLDFEASFIEVGFLLNHEIYQHKNIQVDFGIGASYSFAREDYSKSKNWRETNEIIYDYSQSGRPVGFNFSESFQTENKGFVLISDVMLNYKRLNFILFYSMKLFVVKEIEKLHTITFMFGVCL